MTFHQRQLQPGSLDKNTWKSSDLLRSEFKKWLLRSKFAGLANYNLNIFDYSSKSELKKHKSFDLFSYVKVFHDLNSLGSVLFHLKLG